jgi:hypothetical protein
MCIAPKWFTLGLTLFLALAGSRFPVGPTRLPGDRRDGFPQQPHLESRQVSSPPAFCELQPAQADAMLLPIPDSDDSRYLRLHQYFLDLHCPSKLMEEQALAKHLGKNLMCALPGRNAEQILVVARYDRRRERTGEGWGDAVVLPILYNALGAQPREHTFVFAALRGSAGEKEFFANLRKNTQPAAKAIVVLDSLGMGEPRFYTSTDKLLGTEAALTAQLQGISAPTTEPVSSLVSENPLLLMAQKLPSILIHSTYGRNISAPAFHKEFDFVAYYLCRIDIKFATLTGPPAH